MAKSESDVCVALLVSPDVVFALYCEPCSTEDLNIETASYCQNCQEYLCDKCCRHHRKSSMSRHHKVVDKSTMPKNKSTPKIIDILTETCPKHKEKVLEYFCYTHNDMCCSVCLYQDHNSCQEKSYIPDLSTAVDTAKEYKELVTELNRLVAMATNELENININHQNNDVYRVKAIDAIKACRIRHDKILDNLVDVSFQKVTELHQINEQKINTATRNCKTVLTEVQHMASSLNEKAIGKMNNQLFVEMKISQSHVPSMENELNDVTERKLSRYVFVPNGWLINEIQDGENPKRREVCVKSEEDKEDCLITGISVLSKDHVVVIDSDNFAVKLIDMKMNKVISRLSLSSKPFAITRTDTNQVAVALRQEKKIEIITVSDVLSRSHSIDVPGYDFTGMCHDGQHFYLVYACPRVIRKVDMSGRVVRTVFEDSDSELLFKRPWSITLSRGQDLLYVSDELGGTVTCLTLSGKVASVYSNVNLKEPEGIVVGADDHVYVCGSVSNNVFQLTRAGNHVKVLLKAEHGLVECPRAIDYSMHDNALVISSSSAEPNYGNYIQMFKLE